MKKLLLSIVLLISNFAHASSISIIDITPVNPITSDTILANIYTEYPTTGYDVPPNAIASITGNSIFVDINTIPPPPGSIVLQVLTSGLTSVDLGQLEAGEYSISVNLYEGFFNFQDTLTQSFVVNAVPIPSAIWLFGSGLLGLVSMARSKKAA